MPRRRFEHLLAQIGVLRHPCDLDLLLFFHRNPQAILTSEHLAAYVGYPLGQIAHSLDLLTETGLLERSQHPAHAARMYVLTMPPRGWLKTLLEIGSTREGRRELLHAMEKASGRLAEEGTAQGVKHIAATVMKRRATSR